MTKKNKIVSVIGFLLLVVTTLVSGIVQGRMSQRWGNSPDGAEAAARLGELPAEFGNWKVDSSSELAPAVQEILQCQGYINRTYVNQQSGEAVHVAVLLGPHGPISVHTPEVCYSSRDYAIERERKKVVLDGAGDDTADAFWRLELQRSELDSRRLYVYFAWGTGGDWVASKYPRWEFRMQPYLYKIQMAYSPADDVSFADAADETEESDDQDEASNSKDPGRRFLESFVPELKHYLRPTTE